MKYKAIIFDMDGTLIDSIQDIGEAVNRVLVTKNLPPHDLDQYRFFVGAGVRVLMEKAMPPEEISEFLLVECQKLFLAEYKKTWREHSKLYPGIAELLDGVEKLGVAKSILSNKPDDFTKAFSEEFLSSWEFTHVLGNSDKVPRKPDPQGANLISEQLKIDPREFIFVGDTQTDMQTAIAAGMTPIGVSWGFRPVKELQENGAQMILEQPLDLLKLIF